MTRRGWSAPPRPLAPASAENSRITKRRPAGARKRALGEPAAGGVRAGLGLAAAPQGKRAQVRSRGPDKTRDPWRRPPARARPADAAHLSPPAPPAGRPAISRSGDP